MSQFSDSQTITIIVIVTAALVYPLILSGVAALGYFQSKAETKAS